MYLLCKQQLHAITCVLSKECAIIASCRSMHKFSRGISTFSAIYLCSLMLRTESRHIVCLLAVCVVHARYQPENTNMYLQ